MGEINQPYRASAGSGTALYALNEVHPVTMVSCGRTLIIDTDPSRAGQCEKVLSAGHLECTVLIVTGRKNPAANIEIGHFWKAQSVSITGAFSRFTGVVTVKGEKKEIAGLGGAGTAPFDLVLDMQNSHSFVGGRPPLGYFAAGSDAGRIRAALAELPEMRGQFKKPQFAVFAADRCFHGRSRSRDCSACLEVCAYGAMNPLKSAGGGLFMDHFLCQGCGACALVCRADAVRMVQPSHEELLGGLRDLLLARQTEAGRARVVFLTDLERLGGAEQIVYRLDSIAYAGLDLILSTLAYGAERVIIACSRNNSLSVRSAIEREVQTARAVLAGISIPKENVRFMEVGEEGLEFDSGIQETLDFSIPARELPARPAFSHGPDRRTTIQAAVRFLNEVSGAGKTFIDLPAGAPFGAISIDKDTCTLCKSCIDACPAGALSTGGARHQVAFFEPLCHQCGLCREVCPERAIELHPRLQCEREAPETERVLHRAEPLCCVECGKPFASERMIHKIETKLKGHWMYSGERQSRRLRMCPLCRTRDALTSRKGKSWNRL